MELLNSIFNFITNKTNRLSHKATFLLLTLILVILIDNTLSFSYYYNTSNKIEQVSGINKILSDTSLTATEKKTLLSLRNDLIDRSTLKDKTWSLINQLFEFKPEKNKNLTLPESRHLVKRNDFWHYVSSGWIFLLMALIMPIIGFTKVKTSFGGTVLALLLIEPILLGIAWLYALFFSFIPQLFGNYIFNYILNFILCILSLIVFKIFVGEDKPDH